MMTIDQQKRIDAQKFLNCQVKAQKLMRKQFASLGDIRALYPNDTLQITNLVLWCELLGIEYHRRDWDGNEVCNSNWDEVYFEYKGYTFFELVSKVEEE